jgi:hypothetical protein
MNEITINFAKLQDIAVKGVRRTSIFMGLGINGANDPNLKEYQLSGVMQFRFVPNNVDEKTLLHFKDEFGRWIVACGFRELIETYSVFLDEVNCSCLLIEAAGKQIPLNKVKPIDAKFRRHPRGIEGKLDDLKNKFSVEMTAPSYLLSINKARNCLTHRRGIVAKDDFNDGNQLTVLWKGIDLHTETESGETVSVQPMSQFTPSQDLVVPGHGWLKGIYCERKKSFPQKSSVSFLPGELAEICYFFTDATNDIITSAQTYAANTQPSKMI